LELTQAFATKYGCHVLHGPFRGLEYSSGILESHHAVPKLLGSYELELHGVINDALSRKFDTVIDIGCAEGYYAVGFAKALAARVYAFDTERGERRLCQEMARLNGVSNRLYVGGWCDRSVLKELILGRTLIFSDCEGYEVELFNPNTVQILGAVDLLIEVHDSLVPDGTETLTRRFESSHRVQRILPTLRHPEDFAELTHLGGKAAIAVSEHRGESAWLYMTSRYHSVFLA
jgi:ribosomal protein L11 methylase PrmA